jgi:hypothetical protein
VRAGRLRSLAMPSRCVTLGEEHVECTEKQGAQKKLWKHLISRRGGVGEWLKPPVLKGGGPKIRAFSNDREVAVTLPRSRTPSSSTLSLQEIIFGLDSQIQNFDNTGRDCDTFVTVTAEAARTGAIPFLEIASLR